MEPGIVAAMSVLVFIVAAHYSSVGHGGASGYPAVLFVASAKLLLTLL